MVAARQRVTSLKSGVIGLCVEVVSIDQGRKYHSDQ